MGLGPPVFCFWGKGLIIEFRVWGSGVRVSRAEQGLCMASGKRIDLPLRDIGIGEQGSRVGYSMLIIEAPKESINYPMQVSKMGNISMHGWCLEFP